MQVIVPNTHLHVCMHVCVCVCRYTSLCDCWKNKTNTNKLTLVFKSKKLNTVVNQKQQ